LVVSNKKERYVLNLKISLLFVASFIYFLTAYFVGYRNVRDILDRSPFEVSYAAERVALSRQLLLYMDLLIAHNHSMTPYDSLALVDPKVVKYSIEHLRTVHNDLINGNKELHLGGVVNERELGSVSLQDELLYNNGCLPPDDKECLEFRKGVMQRGLHNAYVEYIKMGEELLEYINTTYYSHNLTARVLRRKADVDLNPKLDGFGFPIIDTSGNLYLEQDEFSLPVVKKEFSSEEFKTFKDMETKYLHKAGIESTKLYVETMRQNINKDYNQIAIISLALFLVLNLILYLFLYSPLIRKLDIQLKQTNAMLLLVPVEILDSLPEIHEFIRAYRNMAN